MNRNKTISLFMLLPALFISCEKDAIVLPDSNKTIEWRKGKPGGNPGSCTNTFFCVQLSGEVTSNATTTENCANDNTTAIVVSTSSGPNNTNMTADLSQISSCFGAVTGPMGISKQKKSGNAELTLYFQNTNGDKYVLKATNGVITGDWLPINSNESATVDFSGQDWEIKREGKGQGKNDPCVESGTFSNATASVSNGSCP
jgi:hypothetical protein